MKKYRYLSNGYVRIFRNKKLIQEHRYIMEEVLGRKLTKKEVVHHIDGNRLNNDLSNLVVMDDSKHRRIHLLGKPRECSRKFEIFNNLPETTTEGRIVSIRPDYRTYITKRCVNCGKLFWVRKDKKTTSCSNKCAITIAWKDGKYERRAKRTAIHCC